jgi:hypothetical protein
VPWQNDCIQFGATTMSVACNSQGNVSLMDSNYCIQNNGKTTYGSRNNRDHSNSKGVKYIFGIRIYSYSKYVYEESYLNKNLYTNSYEESYLE